jgi:4-amino-4-deoxy-L-arabinose transferase-like glycosyltransferase
MLRWDEAEYAALGRAIWRGEAYARCGLPESLRPPGLPVALAAAFAVSGGASDVAARRAALALASGALLAVWAIARGPWGAAPALAAALLLGLMPAFWRSAQEVMTELAFLGAFAAALVLFDRGLAAPRLLPWAAAFCGLALAFRYTAVLALPVGAALVLHAAARDRKALFRTLRGRWPWVAIAVLVLVAGPWLARQTLRFGDPLVGLREAAGQLGRFLPELSMPVWYYASALPGMVTWPVLLLAIAGAVEAWRRRDDTGRCATLVVAVLLLWFSAYRFKEERQITAALPWVALLAVLGGRALLRGVAVSPRGRLALAALGLGAIALVAGRQVDAEVRNLVALGYPSLVRAMNVFRARSAPTDRVVAASQPQVCWYADRPTSDLPAASDGASGLRASSERAEWLVLVNYERGQESWATELLGAALRGELPGALLAADGQFVTAVVPTGVVPTARVPSALPGPGAAPPSPATVPPGGADPK